MYILKCADRSYYVGSTNDVKERLLRHNTGEAAEWTKSRRPVEIVQEEHKSLLEARQREKQIKGWTREKKEKLISGVWKKQ